MKANMKVRVEISKTGIASIVGTKLDDAQYIAMTLKGEADRGKGRVDIGKVEIAGRIYNVSIVGHPMVTNHNGESITSNIALAPIIIEDKLDEINFDTLAYLEVSGKLPDGRDYIGVFHSIADIEKHAEEFASEM